MIQSFLMLGQSNMAGRGFIHEVSPIYNEKIKMLRNGRWQMMTEPINYDRPVSGISLAGSFAAAWCRTNREDTIGLIPCAEGGSSIDEWSADGMLFRHAMAEAGFAMQTSELAGILWHQGESDSSGGNYKTYYNKLLQIIKAARKALKAPEVPLIIGGLGDYLGQSGFGTYCTEYSLINRELQTFAREQSNCYFVTASGLTCNPDGIHFDAVSQRRFGLRYFEAFSKKQHVLEPLVDEQELMSLIIEKTLTKSERTYLVSMDFALGKLSFDEFQFQLAQINQE